MIGWQIYIFQEKLQLTRESFLATWMTGPNGLDWPDALVKEGKAVMLGENGYPSLYTAPAKIILPIISHGPPSHNSPMVFGDDYFLPVGWTGEICIHDKNITQCDREGQLMIEAWDQS